MKEEKQRLEYTINRFDHYYDTVNNKAAVYLGINTFVTGGAIALLTQFSGHASQHRMFHPILGAILLLGILSLVVLAWASIPYFTKKSESLYYFGTIGKMEFSQFSLLSEDHKKKENLKDLRKQVHALSKGLTKKFEKLKIVGFLLFIQFILLFPIAYLLIFKN